ncbi:MAG: DUF1295 domain-containing protein [Myxococcales bacterium]|nr:DUF1295 domain-containing protein [Myxococcales bacterium]
MTERGFKLWRWATVFFANVPNLILVVWLFFWVTRTGRAQAPAAPWCNLGLFALFAGIHSAMSTPRYKRWFTARWPAAFERAVFTIVAGVTLLALMALWRPMPRALWEIEGPAGWALDALYWIAFAGAASVSTVFDQAAFAGTRQLSAHYKGKALPAPEFHVRGWFRWSRNPMYFFMIVLMWSASTMTTGRLLFAAVSTAYFIIGARFEERRHLRELGETYAKYQRGVSMFVPLPNRYAPDDAGGTA